MLPEYIKEFREEYSGQTYAEPFENFFFPHPSAKDIVEEYTLNINKPRLVVWGFLFVLLGVLFV